MSGKPPPEMYPRYCFELSPTANAWCLLRATEVHDLETHQGFQGTQRWSRPPRCEGFYFYKNLPIKWIRVVGVVVAVDEFLGKRVFTIDDSSGVCIEAMLSVPSASAPSAGQMQTTATNTTAEAGLTAASQQGQDLQVGAVVDIKGKLSDYREEKQIRIQKLTSLRSTEQEVALWEKRSQFRREVLDIPWVLRRRDVRRRRKEAEQAEREQERKKKRLAKASAASTLAGNATAADDRPRHATRGPRGEESDQADLQEVIRRNAGSGKFDALGL